MTDEEKNLVEFLYKELLNSTILLRNAASQLDLKICENTYDHQAALNEIYLKKYRELFK
jgi:hypothetical protein